MQPHRINTGLKRPGDVPGSEQLCAQQRGRRGGGGGGGGAAVDDMTRMRHQFIFRRAPCEQETHTFLEDLYFEMPYENYLKLIEDLPGVAYYQPKVK